MDNLDDLFLNEFLKGFEEQEQKKTLLSREQQQIAQRKSEELEPIRKFLQKFIDLEVKVKHCDYHSRDVLRKLDITNDSQLFNFYNEESSESFAPGISILIDHPAQIEIAVPNNYEKGLFVVSVATYHPDAHLLAQSYGSLESVCQALARFISKNTVSISKEAKSIMNKERQTTGSVKTIPQVNNLNNANNNSNVNSNISPEQQEEKNQEFLKSIPDTAPKQQASSTNNSTKERKFDADHLLKNMKHIDKIMKKHNSEDNDESNEE